MEAVFKPGVTAARLRIDLKWVILGVCVAVVAYLAVIPLGFLLWQSFFTPQTAAKPAELTLGNYAAAYTSVQTAKLFLNSLAFAVGTSGFSLVVGTALAWMNERTNTPFKRLFFGLALVPLIIPGIMIMAIAMIMIITSTITNTAMDIIMIMAIITITMMTIELPREVGGSCT